MDKKLRAIIKQKKLNRDQVIIELENYILDRIWQLSVSMNVDFETWLDFNWENLKDLKALEFAIVELGACKVLDDDEYWDSKELKYECYIQLDRINLTKKEYIKQLKSILHDDVSWVEQEPDTWEEEGNPFIKGIAALKRTVKYLEK